jgi:hypothetical protein
MPFPSNPFSGSNFFYDLRPKMDSGRGMFAGADGALRYVVMDANFYRLDVYVRPATKTFAGGAEDLQAVDQSVRVIANAQHCNTYYYGLSPGPPTWQGEIIVEHTVQPGTPASFPNHRYLGQWDGIGEQSYWIQQGDPSEVTSPTTLRSAIGRLLPILQNGIPFGLETLRDPVTGETRQWFSHAVAVWKHEWDFTGKIIAGIHRGAQVVFILVQQHAAFVSGESIFALIERLRTMGVDDAVMGDGSTSVSLTVDGTSELYPFILQKNNSIGTGFAFRLLYFSLAPGAKLTAHFSSTHPNFQPGFATSGVGATIRQWFGGARLTLGSLGTGSGLTSPAIANQLGITLPLIVDASTSRVDTLTTFTAPKVKAELSLQGTVTSAGKVVGKLYIESVPGRAVFDVDWPLVAWNDI